jgi:5-methylcytosine-specific restriction enzyme subunit McrC
LLVYPTELNNYLNEYVGEDKIRVRSLTFSLHGNLEDAGKEFLKKLFS